MDDAIVELGATRVVRVPQDAQWLLHAEPHDAPALSRHAGVTLTDTLLHAEDGGGWAALHLSPDEWLLIAEDATADPRALFAGADVPLSLVDISDRSRAVDLIGPDAVALLGGACPMDLEILGEGGCTRTLLGKVTVMIWRRSSGWRLSYARSYDDYVLTLLRAVAFDLADEALSA